MKPASNARQERLRPGSGPRMAAALAAAIALGGCAPATEDLDAWTQQQRAGLKPNLPALAEPPRFEPLAYTAGQGVDPFDPARTAPPGQPLAPASERAGAASTGAPPHARPLEEMTLVGTLRGPAGLRALLRVDGRVFAVAPGDPLGPHGGRVVGIDERRVEVRENLRTPAGRQEPRTTMLQMQGAPR